MMPPICPRFLNMINDFVLLRFRARTPEDLSAIEVIYIIFILFFEYNIPLCVAFVDCEKAFDSVQTQAILTSLQAQGIEDVYIEILKDIYTDSSVTVHMHKESEKIRIKRGVRQGDTISPKLFTATLESIVRRLNWENKSVYLGQHYSI